MREPSDVLLDEVARAMERQTPAPTWEHHSCLPYVHLTLGERSDHPVVLTVYLPGIDDSLSADPPTAVLIAPLEGPKGVHLWKGIHSGDLTTDQAKRWALESAAQAIELRGEEWSELAERLRAALLVEGGAE